MCGFFWLTDLCEGITMKPCARSFQCSECVMHSVFRDWLSTHPNFSTVFQAVLVLKNMQAHHRKRVELKSLIFWKLFNSYDSRQTAVKEDSGHKGESRTTSSVRDVLAGRIRRTTAHLRVSLSWSWEHQGALQPLPLLQTSSSNGTCQWVPKMNCNPKSGCCGGATRGRVGGQLHPTSCFAGAALSAGTAPAPAWLCPCSPARPRGWDWAWVPRHAPDTGAAGCTLWGGYGHLMFPGAAPLPLRACQKGNNLSIQWWCLKLGCGFIASCVKKLSVIFDLGKWWWCLYIFGLVFRFLSSSYSKKKKKSQIL